MSHQTTILLIEDSPTQAISTQALLQETGARVLCAINGRMGLRLAKQIQPDVIVLDVQLPDINGFDVCACLKQDAETKAIPVIMLTRDDNPSSHKLGSELGAVDYIPKDAFASRVLVETIRAIGLIE